MESLLETIKNLANMQVSSDSEKDIASAISSLAKIYVAKMSNPDKTNEGTANFDGVCQDR
jgi:hypothetical protein